MKESIKNFIRFSTFVIITIILVLKVGEVFIPEKGDKKSAGVTYTIKGYYKLPNNSIDALFLGDSSMLWGISPMEMWKKEGIAAYNYSVTSIRTYGIYYLLKDALKTQHPDVVIIDPVTMFYHYDVHEPTQRIQFDYLKNNITKFEMVNDPNFKNTFEDKMSIFFPLLRYHSRWSEMNLDEFSKLTRNFNSVTRGFTLNATIKPNAKGFSYMDKENKNIKFENNSKEYLLKINELCKENNTKLMILVIPDALSWGKEQSRLIKEVAEDNNIDILDMNLVDFGLDWNTDTKDEGIHFNILGALKLTNYVTGYLKDNYNLEDHRGQKEYENWDKDYTKYKKLRDLYVKKAEDNIKNETENNNKKN